MGRSGDGKRNISVMGIALVSHGQNDLDELNLAKYTH